MAISRRVRIWSPRFQVSADAKTKEARTLLVRTKADMEALAKKDDEDWRKRGTTGNLAGVDAAAKTFTVKAGPRDITVKPSEKTVYLRYSPDSAKMADAKPSSFTELKPGDEIHVLGDKNADGTEIAAEKVRIRQFSAVGGDHQIH